MYQVVVHREAARVLERVTPGARARLTSAVDGLAVAPFRGKRLRGELEGLFSLRIGPWRIVYSVEAEERLIVVHAIGARGGVHR